jgi:hypothetical protein
LSDEEIIIPYWPRPQFEPYHDRTQRFAKIVAHRRFGKTVGTINDTLKRALLNDRTDPPPRYAYVAPTYSQAKDVAWSYLKHYSAPLPGLQASENELWVEYLNGARIRLYGAENYDRLRGLYFDGVIIDEPAQQDPRAWPEVIRPTLSDFQGWATFIGTPKGRNWFYSIGREKLPGGVIGGPDPTWFNLILPATDTLETMQEAAKLIGKDWIVELADAKRDLTPEQYAQEYECSFEAAIMGAYYGHLMSEAETQKRITGVPYEPTARVWTAWDLGYSDPTAIWFVQVVGREIHLIDYYENNHADIGHYVREIVQRPYVYAGHILPFDSIPKEQGTGKSLLETVESLGLRPTTIAPNHRVDDGINACRVVIPRCWFDRAKTLRGVDALKLYRAEYDDRLQTLRPRPVHDWTSHAADAFRYMAMTIDRKIDQSNFNRRIEAPRVTIV